MTLCACPFSTCQELGNHTSCKNVILIIIIKSTIELKTILNMKNEIRKVENDNEMIECNRLNATTKFKK